MGDAIAALALTLAVQQFLKPVYVFRLATRGLRLWHIYALCIFGVVAAVIAAILPNMPISRFGIWAYPIFWEIVGGLCFLIAYASLAIGSTLPLTLRPRRYAEFARGVAAFLSEREHKDYLDIAQDVLRNLPKLLRQARFTERHWRGMTAFFGFTHRHELEDGNYAASLLQILSDREFCRSLVEGSPWFLAATLNEITSQKLVSDSAESFVQELAKQAVLSDRSIMAREVGFQGFSHAPVLTEAIFANQQILRHYRPFMWLTLDHRHMLKEGVTDRLGKAAESAVNTLLANEEYWQPQLIYDLKRLYEDLLQALRAAQQNESVDAAVTVSITSAIENIVEAIRKSLLANEHMAVFYLDDIVDPHAEFKQRDIIGATAELIAASLQAISRGFLGADDRMWFFAFDVWSKLFPHYGREPAGMDPLQQRLSLILLRDVDDNLKGYYPPILRVLLPLVGSYDARQRKGPKSAAILMQDAIYFKLKGLRRLAQTKPDQLEHYIPPPFVTYDPETNLLNHITRNGTKYPTNLSAIRPRMPKLDPQSIKLR